MNGRLDFHFTKGKYHTANKASNTTNSTLLSTHGTAHTVVTRHSERYRGLRPVQGSAPLPIGSIYYICPYTGPYPCPVPGLNKGPLTLIVRSHCFVSDHSTTMCKQQYVGLHSTHF